MKRLAIIGGGISGLSVAYYLQKKAPRLSVILYEAASRPGGVLKTETIEGCVVDGGPDSFLTMKKAGIELCREIGLQDALVGSNDSDRKTFLYHDGALKPLPEGFFLMIPTRIWPFVVTDLLSWPGKMAALRDLFTQPETQDCAAGEFIENRFGKEILEQIAEPLLAGVYGADIMRLSLKTALPQLWEAQKKGSLIRAMAAAGRRNNNVARESLFTTLAGGMETLTNALQGRCPTVEWRFNTTVPSVDYSGGQWKIGSDSFDGIVWAASSAPNLHSEHGAEIGSLIRGIRKNSAIVVSLGYRDLQREGFGWLVPLRQRRSVLAATYVNNKFKGKAAEDRFLIRAFIGGSMAEEWIGKADGEIEMEVLSELKRIAAITEKPEWIRIFRWKNAMPEYAVGHEDRVARIEKLAGMEQNLFFAGNLFSGIGIPDCIRYAEQTADRIALSCELKS